MSHFTVTVVGENIQEQLAPFQENNMGNCPSEYLEFHDTENESLQKYNTESRTMKKLADGTVVDPYAERYANNDPKSFLNGPRYIYPEGTTDFEVPFKELYETFEDYMSEYEGSKERDNKTNRYGYWENPNAKWDWFEVGGRWAGRLFIKPEFRTLYGDKPPNFSWGWDEKSISEVTKECRVDSAKKGHVDWDAMMGDNGEKAAKRYDFVTNLLAKTPVHESWEVFINGEYTAEKKKAYWEQPRCAVWKQFVDNNDNKAICKELGISMWDGSPDDYLGAREQYINTAKYAGVSTFAFLRNGKWAERGKMGWWACVSNEKDNWEEIFYKFLQDIPDEETITVVDCHI